ncbi:MAG: response regulator [bacterium]|nr:response regulator [bacterium]
MPRVLVIDDEQSICSMLEGCLIDAGYTVDSALNGRQGLQKIREHQPDIVITDIVMPEMEGMEMIREVRLNYPNIPIIAISGFSGLANLDYLDIAKCLGAGKVFAKPISNRKLLEAIDELLGAALEN